MTVPLIKHNLNGRLFLISQSVGIGEKGMLLTIITLSVKEKMQILNASITLSLPS